MSVWLGFDFGLKRIGVAVGERLTGGARPLRTLGRDWPALDALIREWAPEGLVVGLPLAEDGGEQPMSRHARAFAAELRQRSGLPVYTCDERYSSLAADSRLRDTRRQARSDRRRARGSDTDQEAARILLEQWLTQLPPSGFPDPTTSPPA